METSYRLDGELVAVEIARAGLAVKRHIRALLGGEEAGVLEYIDWINTAVKSRPEIRWATLDSNYIIAKTLLTSAGEVARSDFSNIIDALSNPAINLSAEEKAGVMDASVILLSKTALDHGLKDEWLWYASQDCPEERYLHLMGTIIAASCSLVTLFANKSRMKPTVLWDKINK